MSQHATRHRHAGFPGALGLGWWILAIASAPASVSAAPQPSPSPFTQVATASVAPAEGSQEALLRELAMPPALPPEIFSDLLPYSVPAPIIGGLGVEVE